jgi:Domain of Unknown Function (DUF1080)
MLTGMKKIILLSVAFCFLGTVIGQQMNTLSENEKKQGWELLFDGQTMSGWHSFKKSTIGKAWKVQEGSIYLDIAEKEGRGDIVTDKEFKDFHFMFDWKVAPKANSGIILLVQDRDPYQATWHTGPEYQLIDNVNYPSKLEPKQLSASLYDLIGCSPELVKPAGEWNTGAIKLEKGKLEFYVNGKLAVSTMLWDDNWKKLVEGSKFIKEKDFAKFPNGRLAIQDHGGELWLRNLKIKSL